MQCKNDFRLIVSEQHVLKPHINFPSFVAGVEIDAGHRRTLETRKHGEDYEIHDKTPTCRCQKERFRNDQAMENHDP